MPKKEVEQIVCPLCRQEMEIEKGQSIFECFEGQIHSFATNNQAGPLARKIADLDCETVRELILS